MVERKNIEKGLQKSVLRMDGMILLTRPLNGSLFWGRHGDSGGFFEIKFVIGQSKRILDKNGSI